MNMYNNGCSYDYDDDDDGDDDDDDDDIPCMAYLPSFGSWLG